MVLWDYCAQRRALINNLTPKSLFQLGKTSPFQYQFGVQGDISALCNFGWYDWCYYREEGTIVFPLGKEMLGKVLGPSKNEGNEMAQNVLAYTGKVVPRRSLRRLTQVELESESEKSKRAKFTAQILSRLGDSLTLPPPAVDPESVSDYYHDDREDDDETPTSWIDGDPLESDGSPTYEHSLTDTLIHAEVLLPKGKEMANAKVKGRHLNDDGDVVGTFDADPFLNSIIYDVEFSDGTVK